LSLTLSKSDEHHFCTRNKETEPFQTVLFLSNFLVEIGLISIPLEVGIERKKFLRDQNHYWAEGAPIKPDFLTILSSKTELCLYFYFYNDIVVQAVNKRYFYPFLVIYFYSF